MRETTSRTLEGEYSDPPKENHMAAHSGPSVLLKATLLAILCVPSYLVVKAVGASGNVPHLLALMLFMVWVAASIFGLHNPLPYGHPGRAGLLLWIFASMISYAAMTAGFSGDTYVAERAAADRWMLLLFSGAGITFTTTESLRHMMDLKVTLRWVMGGAVFCSVVAAFQFILKINPVKWIGSLMVGFTDGGAGAAFQAREAFLRVSGTTMHPIELAAVSSMLLPLAIWWSLFDRQVLLVWRVTVPVMILAANVFTISRTGMIGLAISTVIFVPFLPRTARRWALVIAPSCLMALFLAIPGMVSTMLQSATVGTADSSITYRLDDYPMAWRLFIERPWLGQGPGTWLPSNLKDVYDNQYLVTSTTLGAIGLLAMLAYFLFPAVASLVSARHAPSQELRTLGGALASGMFTATLAAATFDAFSFQTFVFIVALFVGLSGFLWNSVLLAAADRPIRGQYGFQPSHQQDPERALVPYQRRGK